MKNYQESDYALNKFSAGIVYGFADSIVEYTLADYLVENPSKTEADFRELKKLSDEIYLEQVRAKNAQTKKNTPLEELSEVVLGRVPSPEELIIGKIDSGEESERHEHRLAIARQALDRLTDTQRRRYLLHRADGMTMRKIADSEGVGHTKIQKSLDAAEKKIKKFLDSDENGGTKRP